GTVRQDFRGVDLPSASTIHDETVLYPQGRFIRRGASARSPGLREEGEETPYQVRLHHFDLPVSSRQRHRPARRHRRPTPHPAHRRQLSNPTSPHHPP